MNQVHNFKIVDNIMEEIKGVTESDIEQASKKLVPMITGYEVMGSLSPALIFLATFINKMKVELSELAHQFEQEIDKEAARKIEERGDALDAKVDVYMQFLALAAAADFDLFGADDLSISEGWVVSAPPVAPCGHRHAPKSQKVGGSTSDIFRDLLAGIPGVRVIEV